jgi:hypothetical protein
MDTVTMTRIGLKDCHGTLYECPCGGEFAVLEEAWEPKACPRCGGRVEKVVLPEDDSASWEQIGAYGEQRRADDRDGTRERLKAPRGMFRVVGVDTFEGPREDYLVGDYGSKAKALKVAKRHGGQMNPVHVYDDQGNSLAMYGSV